jgi:demethylmenaquinone methyltransferase/2-methoxy-6-polyprenyl-1,4-benzoquinol methylase
MRFTDFGFEEIPLREKAKKVQDLFGRVASSYDLMNDLMSLGVHRLWKQNFIHRLPLKENQTILDVAGGTGDIAIGIQKAYPHLGLKVMVCDLTLPMIEEGRNNAINKGILHDLHWCNGSAESLPIPDQSIDIYTIVFGLRNVADKEKALLEAYRVLKPGGHFFCLEFSHPVLPILSKAYDTYSFKVLPLLGKYVAKDQDAYQYLVESIRQFPDQQTLIDKMNTAGFKETAYENWWGGIAAIHWGIIENK